MNNAYEFERRLSSAMPFAFAAEWHGRDGRVHHGAAIIHDPSDAEMDYVAAVLAAQDDAADALDDARAAYFRGNNDRAALVAAIAAIDRACAAEERCTGGCPTYRDLRDYLRGAIDASRAAEGIIIVNDGDIEYGADRAALFSALRDDDGYVNNGRQWYGGLDIRKRVRPALGFGPSDRAGWWGFHPHRITYFHTLGRWEVV